MEECYTQINQHGLLLMKADLIIDTVECQLTQEDAEWVYLPCPAYTLLTTPLSKGFKSISWWVSIMASGPAAVVGITAYSSNPC
jgi:hypothetical protein